MAVFPVIPAQAGIFIGESIGLKAALQAKFGIAQCRVGRGGDCRRAAQEGGDRGDFAGGFLTGLITGQSTARLLLEDL